jgi:hypothetical protein
MRQVGMEWDDICLSACKAEQAVNACDMIP